MTMTKQDVLQFLSEIRGNEELQAKLHAVSSDLESLLRVANEAGYSFTAAEFISATVDSVVATGVELSPAELEEVAGGGDGINNKNRYTTSTTDLECALVGPTG
jgi:predicted ribosomally synthesized peptide with nif11-like leader